MKFFQRISRSWFYLVAIIICGFLLLHVFTFKALEDFASAFKRISSDFHFHSNSRNIDDCSMILWTQNKQETIANNTLEDLYKSAFNKTHPIKILIHGFSDGASTTWTRTIKNAYLKKGDFNVFSLNWRPLALAPWYSTAVNNAETAGLYTSKLVELLVNSVGVPWENIHVIGASLGAHVAGYAGAFLNGRLERITGLDPCGPLFHVVSKDHRLDSSDAKFVDVIHTAGKWVGNDDLIGHVDFFPNLGQAPQPGCDDESLDLSCSHFMSWKLFSVSINSVDPFYAIECQSRKDFKNQKCCGEHLKVVTMGDQINHTIRGTFYLKTDHSKPHKTKNATFNCDKFI